MIRTISPEIDMDNNLSKRNLMFPFGLPVLIVLIAFYRAYYIAQAIAPNRMGSEIAILLGLCILPLGVVTLLCLATTGANRSWFRKTLILLAILCVCAFALDTFVIVELDNRLTGTNIIKYLPEWRMILHFAKPEHFLILAAAFLGSLINIPLTNTGRKRLFQLCLIMVIAGVGLELSLTSHLYKYSFLGRGFHEQTASNAGLNYRPYSTEELNLYKRYSTSSETTSIPNDIRNIILLIVESFSAADSLLISGLHDRMKRFDQLSMDGTLFTNFYANSTHTEGGMISILVGTPPLPFPGSTRHFSDSFRELSAIPESFRTKGYHTEFLTTGPLSFTAKGKFMRDIGFDIVEGREEVPRFRSAQRFAFDSPADEVLFDEAEKRIEKFLGSDAPFFLTLLTVSSHRPIIDPLGRKNTQDNLWDYIDREIDRFYRSLRQTTFFDDGLLMITGDHRKMFPIQENERLRYGESSGYRVPLLLVGNGVPAGRIDDRLFQTTDIFSHLNAAVHPSDQLSIAAIVPDNYSMFYTDGSDFGKFSVFDEDGAVYRAFVQDQVFQWSSEKPANSSEIELSVHYQRATNQFEHARRARLWTPVFHQNCFDQEPCPENESASQNRLTMEVYRGTGINGALDDGSERFLEKRSIRNIDFRDLLEEELPMRQQYAIRVNGTINIKQSGTYWFRVESDDGAGLAIDKRIVVDANRIKHYSPEDGRIALNAGDHQIELRYFQAAHKAGMRLLWRKPGDKEWLIVPEAAFIPDELYTTSN